MERVEVFSLQITCEGEESICTVSHCLQAGVQAWLDSREVEQWTCSHCSVAGKWRWELCSLFSPIYNIKQGNWSIACLASEGGRSALHFFSLKVQREVVFALVFGCN